MNNQQHFNKPIILDCDFCEKAQHFVDRHAPIDEGWNWIEQEYEDDTSVVTVACPEHDAEKVSELAEKKRDNITLRKKPEKGQETLQEATQ